MTKTKEEAQKEVIELSEVVSRSVELGWHTAIKYLADSISSQWASEGMVHSAEEGKRIRAKLKSRIMGDYLPKTDLMRGDIQK